MTDTEMYELLLAKSQDIKMHMDAADVAGIAERFKALSEKQIPMKPVKEKGNRTFYWCPVCDEEVSLYLEDGGGWSYKCNHCPDCGQCLDWGDEE